MTYDLFIGDEMFSSWSLRGWLMLKKFSLPFNVLKVGLYSGTLQQDLAALAPARLVPVLRTPDGDVIGESLAIAETLSERHPDRDLWPPDPALRARARWLCAEMAASFFALRTDCPMQLAHVNAGFSPSKAVLADLARIEEIWDAARSLSGHEDGWLFGSFSLADVFYAPIAARIVGYGLPVSDSAAHYCNMWIADSDFREWRTEGLSVKYEPFPYRVFEPLEAWPTDRVN